MSVGRQWPSVLLLAVLLLLSGPPLIDVVLTSLRTGLYTPHPAWSLTNYQALLESMSSGGALVNTLLFALGASAVALLLGFPLAVIVERTNAPLRRFGYGVAIVLSAVPAAAYAVAWMLMFSRQGLANVAIGSLFSWLGIGFRPLQITNLPGMILVEGLNYVPLTFLLLAGPVRSMDGALEEAARTTGASMVVALLRITTPMLLPSLLATALLTFIRSLESFSVPAILGLPGRVTVITTEIYAATVATVPADYGQASAFGVLLVAVVIGLLTLYTALTRHASRYTTVGGKGFRPRIIDLGWARFLASLYLLLLFLVAIVLPFAVLVIASLQRFYSGASLKVVTLVNYQELLHQPRITQSFIDSTIVGLAAAIGIMVLSFAAAWVAVHSTLRMRRLVEIAVSLPLVLPGIVLGLSLLRLYADLPFALYGTLAGLAIASLIRFLPYGFRYAHTGLLQINGELEEAGLMSGATRMQALRRILLPLVALPLVAGFIFVFMMSVRELEASVFLVTGGTPMVVPILLDLIQNAYLPQVAALATVTSVVFGCLGYGLYVIARRHGLSEHTAPVGGQV